MTMSMSVMVFSGAALLDEVDGRICGQKPLDSKAAINARVRWSVLGEGLFVIEANLMERTRSGTAPPLSKLP